MLQASTAQKQPRPVLPLSVEKGKLKYQPDSLGNRIPDFSYCGYKASAVPLPAVPMKVTVPFRKGDATLRIQAALDYVGKLPADANGFRGTVLLLPGRHEVNGELFIRNSGVVLRGSGTGANGTQLVGTGNDRATLLTVGGINDRVAGAEHSITTAYVPVNAMQFQVTDGAAFSEGDQVIIRRPSSANWIKILGTDHFGGGITATGWKPGERDIFFDRTITAINGNTITIDAPLTTALDSQYGGGFIYKYNWPGRISQSGVENLALESAWDRKNPKDEDHRWMAIVIENANDSWVRQVSFRHFAGSAVMVLKTAKQITVEDCISSEPISEIGGERRNSFFTEGQQTLFQRCVAFAGKHDFAVGYCAAGPNAFVQCESNLPYDYSGPVDSWASGVLFDLVNVDGNAIRFGNRWQDGNGAGWSAANSLLWNCTAARIDCYKPPTAQNWSFGSWSQFAGDGFWAESNNTLHPKSLFYAQLEERLNRNTDQQSHILPLSSEASSSPSVETAAALSKEAFGARPLLIDWIKKASERSPIDISAAKSVSVESLQPPDAGKKIVTAKTSVINGWLVRDGRVLSGRRADIPWWSGGIQGNDLRNAKAAITRFVPGRTGKGYTDNLQEVTDTMLRNNIIGIEQHHALWYDRRRDDHERIRRMDGDVWAPFYEMPYARSGKDTAWDGLSKYDLTKFNPWYWGRMKEFANLADQKGLILVHQNYFQHNIIEAGAHFSDYPWRSANNINNVGFPEPVNYAGDKRVFMAEQFYDTTVSVRNALHKKYIWQCLDNFKGNDAVIQSIGEEFTGPLHFVQFWIDAVAAWERKNKSSQLISLSTTKDVQDAILADPKRAAITDIIDIRYWHYQADGTVYAPLGGQSLAPRQHARLLKPKRSSFEQVYRAVKEYRLKYPGKAVIYSSDGAEQFGWAVFVAGGSLPVLPAGTDTKLLTAASRMRPVDRGNVLTLASSNEMIVYATGKQLTLDLSGYPGVYSLRFYRANDGKGSGEITSLDGGGIRQVDLPEGTALVWVKPVTGSSN